MADGDSMTRRAKAIMVQGTTSDAGKSVMATALCRIYARRGYRVAPFKGQNMSNNAAVCADGGEIGRAQAEQAAAAGVEPTVDMNPVLLKPQSDMRSQVIVHGKPLGMLDAKDFMADRGTLGYAVEESYARLAAEYDIIVIEGAGSPAEINLKSRDITNMFVAHLADAAVLLVGDINRGGVFASLFGTLQLLDERDRARVKGLLINQFRGHVDLLTSGLRQLEDLTGVPVAGVIPYLPDLRVANEDAQSLQNSHRKTGAMLRVAVVRFPHIANFDDFLALQQHPDVDLTYVTDPRDLFDADLIILPGTKATMSDLDWMRQQGLDRAISLCAAAGTKVLGICGGYQMLGTRIEDPEGLESDTAEMDGLGLLPVETRFGGQKRTIRIEATPREAFWQFFGVSEPTAKKLTLSGYEIHVGKIALPSDASTAFDVNDGADGFVVGNVCGTFLHGVLNDTRLVDRLCGSLSSEADDPYDALADHFEKHCDMDLIDRYLKVDR